MKQCKKCGVSVNAPVLRCPLCYATLSPKNNIPEPPAYPNFKSRSEHYNIVIRILLFLSLSASVICFTINALTFKTVWWSLVVISNILYLWISIGTALRKHTKLGFAILVQGLSLSGLILALDLLLHIPVNWALDFVIPFLFLSATLSITIIIIIKHMAIRDFILYFILTALLGFIPLGLMALGLVTVWWPSLVSALYSLLALISIFIFADRATKVELKKRFHI